MRRVPGKRLITLAVALAVAVTTFFVVHGLATKAADVTQHPFAASSPWNAALPDGLKLDDPTCNLGLQDPAVTGWINAAQYSTTIYQAASTDPVLHVFVNGSYSGDLHVPTAAAPAAGADANMVLIDPDGVHSEEFWGVAIDRAGGRLNAKSAAVYDLAGMGTGGSAIRGTGPRAANLSSLGGLIRASDVQSGSIGHALAIAIPASDLAHGWVWPADYEDTGPLGQSYAGTVHMGQLVTIPSSVDLSTLNLTPVGLMIAKALQTYGGYVVDQAGAFSLFAEPSLESQLTPARKDMATIRSHVRCAGWPDPGPGYDAAVGADHPMAYYEMDETGGTTMVSSAGADVNGTFYGSPAFNASPALATGDKAGISFNGSSAATTPVVPRHDFSIELWVKTTNTAGTNTNYWWTGQSLVDGDAPNVTTDYGTSIVAGNAVLHMGDTTNNRDMVLAGHTNVADGAWHQLVFTRDERSGHVAIYVDGQSDATGTGPTAELAAPKGLTVAAINGGTGDYYKGDMDDLAIYDSVLSPTEVQKHYTEATR